jgi:hypothetical protein
MSLTIFSCMGDSSTQNKQQVPLNFGKSLPATHCHIPEDSKVCVSVIFFRSSQQILEQNLKTEHDHLLPYPSSSLIS